MVNNSTNINETNNHLLCQLIELKERASYADNIQDFILKPFIMYFIFYF